MKVIKYNLCTKVNHGTDKSPVWEDILTPVEMGWNATNEEIAKREAYNGEYSVVDDGQPEPVFPADENVSWDAMAEAIAEGVNDV